MKRVGADAIATPALRNANSEECVGGLGLSVGAHRRVRNEIKVEVVKCDRREQVCCGAQGHDSGTPCCGQRSVQAGCQCEVAQEIRAKLKLESLGSLLKLRHRHDASVVQQDMEWTCSCGGKGPNRVKV